jgi:hypothetical protein
MPLSVPASQGKRFSFRYSTQLQFSRQRLKPDTPTIQSGDGSAQVNMSLKQLHIHIKESRERWDNIYKESTYGRIKNRFCHRRRKSGHR